LSNKLGKEVELITEGLQTELDKNIINRIESPIMHIIRNCLDHGIETPDERVKNDKPQKGVLRFIAFYSGASVFIQIQDDGKGIDKKYITDKAISKGIIKYDDVLTEKQIYDIIFYPGFSTASAITDVSGRGVGLDVVKNDITELHGEINVDSEMGLGTSFTFKLPLTLSIVDALVVKCEPYNILIPTGNVLICRHIPENTFKDKDMQYKLQDRCVPVKRLNELLTNNSKVDKFEILVIFSIYDELYGLLVDRIINTIQAVIKPLGEMHKKQHLFIGASQMGDGSMAYVLDTNILLKLKS
jgi:two-component system chemotaxis sensor kinase CheA